MNSFKTQTLCLSDDVEELLCQIDTKLSKVSENRLNSNRYGARICVDYNAYFILSRYRKILDEKVCNSKCLCGYNLDDIISNIKQYLTSGKPQKFAKVDSLSDTAIKPIDLETNTVNVTINYKYGDYITYNSVSNRYITSTVEDVWDQTDW